MSRSRDGDLGADRPRRRSRGERRITSVLAAIPAAREQLIAAMDEFGHDFDIEALTAAAGGDPTARNKVAALERDFELLVNWLDELAARGLVEAKRLGALERSTGTNFERLRAAGAISARSAERLNGLRGLRDDLQHSYVPESKAALLHRGVVALVDELDRYIDRYDRWVRRVGVLPRSG